MRFFVLGPLRAERRGSPLDLGGPKQRTLVAALLAHYGHPVTTGRLIDALWGEHPPATATKTLQKYISQVRKQVGDALITHSGGYAIEVGDDQVDAHRFETLLAIAGRETRLGEKIELLERALELWRGDPYPDLEDPTGLSEQTRLVELRLSAVEDLMQASLDLGEDHQLVGELEALVSQHPLRERLWGNLMLALYRSGRQSEALRAYQRLRRTLGEEMGIEPSREIQELEDQILRQDPALSPGALSPGALFTAHTNMRPPLTSFIGRAAELREIPELLASARLVTLIGPAGSGKTRLATEVGRAHVEEYPDGVWFVDLAPLTSPDQVAAAVAAPLGVGGHAERPTEDVLRNYLPGRRLLLVVDNCEHLVSRVARLVTDLLQADADLTVLATSRERLGVPGEVLYEVPPLAYPDEGEHVDGFDAVALFLERARAADPRFELSSSNWDSVGEICRRLDGMPLAIELAAARVRSFPPDELRRHLGDRFALLASPVRTDLARHQTLQAAVDWSYQLLDHRDRALFRRLSVFRGGFTQEAAAEICGFDPLTGRDVLALLGELIDKSLVVASSRATSDRTRYSLWETLREYGQAQLHPPEAGVLRDRHAAHFRKLAAGAADHLRGPEQRAWLRVLGDDHDNLRKALRWAATTDRETAVRTAIALADYWDSVGPRAEGHEWLERAVTFSDSLTPELRIDARLAACELFSSAHASYSLRYAEEALDEARRINDELSEARALRAHCWALTLAEQPEKATGYGRRALRIFEMLGDAWETGLCLERLAEAGYREPKRAIADLKRSVALYREVSDRNREAGALRKLADFVAQGLGDPETAAPYAAEAVAICEEVGNLNNRAHAQLEYGKILRRLGDPDQAVGMLEEALEQMSKSGDERCSVRTLTALGTAHLERGEEDAALEAFRSSLQRGASLDERHTARVAIAGMALIFLSRRRLVEAATLLGFADRLQHDLKVPVSTSSKLQRGQRLKILRSRMGAKEFDGARQAGEAMSLDQAVAFALGDSLPV